MMENLQGKGGETAMANKGQDRADKQYEGQKDSQKQGGESKAPADNDKGK